jgi:hypothetical protein
MNNLLEFNQIIRELSLFFDQLSKDNISQESSLCDDINQFRLQISNSSEANQSRLPKKFYLIQNIKGQINFSLNVDKFLGLDTDFNLRDFLFRIDDSSYTWNYLKDYVTWAKCVYSFVNRTLIRADEVAYKIQIPLRCSDDRIYWVLQEARAFEMDLNNNLLSHINTYTICNLYKETSPVGLVGELYINDEYFTEWTKIITENRFSIKPFIVSRTQKDILHFFYKRPNATIKSCAEKLKYPVNTLKKYISDSQRKQGIIDMAKVSFPKTPISNLKDVVAFLEKIGWFE